MIPHSERDVYKVVVELPRLKKGFIVLEVAWALYDRVLKICLNSNERYYDLVLKDMMNLATAVTDNLECGNRIKPKVRGDFRVRRDFILKAQGSLEALTKKFNVFIEHPIQFLVGVSNKDLDETYALIVHENELIQGMLDSDERRFGNL